MLELRIYKHTDIEYEYCQTKVVGKRGIYVERKPYNETGPVKETLSTPFLKMCFSVLAGGHPHDFCKCGIERCCGVESHGNSN